jgi:glycosyltransferase involved in cell wall biosynthesis
MKSGHVIFVVNLLQDINILRPLVHLAAHGLKRRTMFLVTDAFCKRDKSGLWQQELREIAEETACKVVFFDHAQDALTELYGKSGVIVAASESHLSAHTPVHDLFRATPSSFVRVTLQHGFECVGFLQSRDQNLAHGRNITFAADVICGWASPERLTSVVPSQRHKLYVAGPTAALQQRPAQGTAIGGAEMGLVCENMHSPRLNVAGDFKTDFLEIFGRFCGALAAAGRKVALRPHPGGQYILKNKVELAENVVLSNAPIYKTDLSRFPYGISAPSSILIDMVLAGIPTAVWQDEGSVIDLGNYSGLTRISTVEEWLGFDRAARENPGQFLEKQDAFLKAQQLLVAPGEVYTRYASLLDSERTFVPALAPEVSEGERILFVANAFVPTLQLSFIKPLADDFQVGRKHYCLITEEEIRKTFKDSLAHDDTIGELEKRIAAFHPTVLVFCRYSGPLANTFLYLAGKLNIPTLYHIDDDLLHIPVDIGVGKHRHHNETGRLNTVRKLLDGVDLVYCSTARLSVRLRELAVSSPIVSGEIYCSGQVLAVAEDRRVRKIGYMASADHAHNLSVVTAALVRYLREHPGVTFEFFGSIPAPPEFGEFGNRVVHAPRIANYGDFLNEFAKYRWDIGICPLTPIPFNLMKANTKWVEYTSVGAAVVASRGTVYDDCCSEGCGILASSEGEWYEALTRLTDEPGERYRMVLRAQEKISEKYSLARLKRQVEGMIGQARKLHLERGSQ